MVGVLTVFLIIGVQLASTPIQGMPIQAVVDIVPDTLNLGSTGRWVTVYIELSEDYDISQIDTSSIMLDIVPVDPTAPTQIGDYDNDGVGDLMVKLDRLTVIDYIWSIVHHMGSQISDKRWEVTLAVTGELFNDPVISFAGSDTITVVILS
jgi:hypothetical protein